MKICLLGGTGAIGSQLQELLASEGHEVHVTTRNIKRLSTKHTRFIYGNAKDASFIRSLENNYDAIVDFMSYKTDEFASRVDLLLNKTGHYVFLSSARVFANASILTESSVRLLDVSTDNDYLQTDEYALTKARQENILIGRDRLNFTIVRPYITYGRERLQLSVLEKEEWLHRALTNRSIVFCKELAKKRTTMTSGYDVARSIKALLLKKACGESYNISDDKSLTWEEILNIYIEEISRYGLHVNVSWIPLSDFITIYRPGNAKYQITVDRLYDRVFDNTKISYVVNTKDFVTPETGLRQCISSFLNNVVFRNINWEVQGRVDRYMKEKAAISDIQGIKSILKYYKTRYIINK